MKGFRPKLSLWLLIWCRSASQVLCKVAIASQESEGDGNRLAVAAVASLSSDERSDAYIARIDDFAGTDHIPSQYLGGPGIKLANHMLEGRPSTENPTLPLKVYSTGSSRKLFSLHSNDSMITASQLQESVPQLPPPRFCILDDPTRSGEVFAKALRVLMRQVDEKKGALHDFFAYGRDRGASEQECLC